MAELGCESRFSWWLRWQRICLRCRRPGFNPWVRKIPWRREWQSTPVFLPGEFHGQRSLMGYKPGVAKSPTRLSVHTFTFTSVLSSQFVALPAFFNFTSLACVTPVFGLHTRTSIVALLWGQKDEAAKKLGYPLQSGLALTGERR